MTIGMALEVFHVGTWDPHVLPNWVPGIFVGFRYFRAYHRSLIVRSVPRVGILIVRRTFDHLHLPEGGDFAQLFCPRGGKFEFVNENVKIPTLCSTPPPQLPSLVLTLIGGLHLGNLSPTFFQFIRNRRFFSESFRW